jgi:hypothetical protein
MKKYIIMAGLIFSATTAQSQCDKFIGAFSIQWGRDAKKAAYAGAEAELWHCTLPFTFSLGMQAMGRAEDTAGRGPSLLSQGTEHFFNLYFKAGFIVHRGERFINVASFSLSARPQFSYAAYLRPFEGNLLVGIVPFYEFRNKAIGGYLQLKVGL